MTAEERELIARARRGDNEAFARMFEQLRPMVFSVACRLVGPDDANDVVMETYLKAWKSLPKFRWGSSLSTWLYRLTHNCAIDWLRARTRRREDLLSEREAQGFNRSELADDSQVRPGQNLLEEERNSEVHRALEQLVQRHRAVLLLRYTDGLSYAEIAAATGVSIGTVMSRLFYAKKKLRIIIESERQP